MVMESLKFYLILPPVFTFWVNAYFFFFTKTHMQNRNANRFCQLSCVAYYVD